LPKSISATILTSTAWRTQARGSEGASAAQAAVRHMVTTKLRDFSNFSNFRLAAAASRPNADLRQFRRKTQNSGKKIEETN